MQQLQAVLDSYYHVGPTNLFDQLRKLTLAYQWYSPAECVFLLQPHIFYSSQSPIASAALRVGLRDWALVRVI